MERKLTTDEVIRRSILKHGDRYDYSKVYYVKHGVNIEIICKKHGSFFQLPDNHIRGKGCGRCAGKNKSTNDVIHEFKLVHGNKYCYDFVRYKSAKDNVKIICSIHGEFYQSVSNHLNGRGCQECSKTKVSLSHKDSEADVIEKFKKIHGDRYDYKKIKYINNRTKVYIVCNIHGVFKQTPNAHLSGSGCLKCGRYSTSTMNRYKFPGWYHNSWQKSALTSRDFDSFKVYVIR